MSTEAADSRASGSGGGTPRLRRLLRAPSLHCIVLGALFFALLPEERPELVVPASGLAALHANWLKTQGRLPTPDEEESALQDLVDNQLLMRAAWDSGVFDGDPAISTRLNQIADFAAFEDASEGEEPLDVARSMGLDRTDVVIQRYVAELMRLAIQREADLDIPSDEELRAHLQEHAARFAAPARARFTHIYVSAGRSPQNKRRPEELLGELSAGGVGPEDTATWGDPFPSGRDLFVSDSRLERIFGPGFAGSLQGVEIGAWVGPVASPYGSHLVWVHERVEGRVPRLAEVKGAVFHHYRRIRRAEHLRRRLDALRDHYDIRVERPATTL